MNQSILFNDDLKLIAPETWHISGFYNGELLVFHISSPITELNDEIIFDWEMQVEDWLESNEPEQNPILLNLA